MNNQSELEFLKDQVNRLNGVLSHYQDMYFERSEKMGSNNLKLIFNNHTVPLLIEYDKIISEMTEEIQSFKTHIEQEQLRVKAITNENERLWNKVKLIPKDGKSSFCDDLNENMQSQLDYLTKEKNNLEQLLTISQCEIDRLQSQVVEHNMKPETILFNEQMEIMRNQFNSSIRDLENEVTSLRDIRRDLMGKLDGVQQHNYQLEKDNQLLIEKCRFEQETGRENLAQLQSGMARIDYLDKEKKDLLTQFTQLQSTIGEHSNNKSEWSATLANIENKYREKEQQLYEASEKINEAYQIAETTIAEKKTAEMRERQSIDECERLRGVLAGILDDAGIRTRQEVDLVKNNYDKQLDRIIQELNLCEQDRQELLVESDQLKRSKQLLEQEIQHLHHLNKDKDTQEHSTEEIIHNRAINAERERDNLQLHIQLIDNSLVKERSEWLRQKDMFDNQISYLQQKLSIIQISCDKAQANADKFSKMLSASEESSSKSRKKYQESLRNSRHEYEILKQASQIKQHELESRLNSTEETQRHTTSEMRQFLTKHQQIAAKWREEAHTLSTQYEEKLIQLSKELDRQKKRNEEMVSLLHESKQQILENQEMMEDQKKTISRLQIKMDMVEDVHPSLRNDNDLSTINDNDSWRLNQFKKQQQKLIRESVARSQKVIVVD